MGIPLMVVEYNLGRESRSSPITGPSKLTNKKILHLGGWFGAVGGIMIFSYYVMIIGWVLEYFVNSLTGTFTGMAKEEISAFFTTLTSNTSNVIIYELVILVILGIIVSKGLVKGIEKFTKIAMPAMCLLFIGLAIYVLTLPKAGAGLRFYLAPDFSKLSFEALLAAIGQVFLSIGVGQGASWVYGSYLDKNADLPKDTTKICLMDTGFAILAGLVIFPAAFSLGIEPDSGFSLLFTTLPNIFGRMTGGYLLGLLFFMGVLIAAITSAIAFTECISSCLMDQFNLDREKERKKAVWSTLGITFLLSIPSIVSFSVGKNIRWFGMDMFSFIDYTSANIFLILAGLFMAIYVGWELGIKKFMEQVNEGSTSFKVRSWWGPLLKFVVPAVIIINLITSNFK
jgi:NSS family neurotransmitter:Na+ symporter